MVSRSLNKWNNLTPKTLFSFISVILESTLAAIKFWGHHFLYHFQDLPLFLLQFLVLKQFHQDKIEVPECHRTIHIFYLIVLEPFNSLWKSIVVLNAIPIIKSINHIDLSAAIKAYSVFWSQLVESWLYSSFLLFRYSSLSLSLWSINQSTYHHNNCIFDRRLNLAIASCLQYLTNMLIFTISLQIQ